MKPISFVRCLALLCSALIFSGCQATRTNNPPPVVPPAPAVKLPYALVRGFYATDRNRTGSTEPNSIYGPGRAEDARLEYGTFQVSVPCNHKLTELERPASLKLEISEDIDKHIVLVRVQPRPLDEFKTQLTGALDRTDRRDVLVFVHGYNVSFDAAARRLGQLVYDLQFKGAPILYSWPSQASEAKYSFDEAAVEWTIPHLEKFLEDLVARTDASAIHLVAHSMGNRALTRALQLIARRQSPAARPMFHHIIMAAPDIDAGVLRELAREINGTGNRLTLYASSNDKALQISKRFHGYPRAGESGDQIVVVPRVDTIDVSRIDTSLIGHSYYGNNTSVVSDLRKILLLNLPPPERCDCLVRCEKDKLPFWVFHP